MTKSILLVAGEVSGDEHAAPLVEVLRAKIPSLAVFGMGGSRLRQAGMEIVVDAERHASVMGITELFGSIRRLLRAKDELLAEVDRRRPEVAILLDFPDFNLRLAKALKRRGIKVLYYISPQVWAWRKGRVKMMRRVIDEIAAIFPFEEGFYREHKISCHYVGHPFMDRPEPSIDRIQFFTDLGLDSGQPTLALLPGSRQSEMQQLLPTMIEALVHLRRGRPGLQAIIPVAPTLDAADVQAIVGEVPGVGIVRGQAESVLAVADAAVVASGTATVQAAIQNVPFLVVYRLSALSYAIARRLVTGVPFVAMPNLIAGRQVVEELLQERVTAEEIAAGAERLLGDPSARARVRRELALVRERLTVRGDETRSVSERVGDIVLQLLGEGSDNSRARRRSWRNAA